MTPGTSTSGHVLLIDRDENSRRIYSAMLQHLGFAVSAVSDCASALCDPCIDNLQVLLVNPHDCDEGELVRLRAAAAVRGAATLAITSRVTAPELAEICSDGFDAVLLKPIGPAEVAAAVRLALQHGSTTLPDAVAEARAHERN